MTIEAKINYLWTVHLHRAIGASHAAPFDYADAQVASLRATLRAIERRQSHAGTGHPQHGSRAGRRQYHARNVR